MCCYFIIHCFTILQASLQTAKGTIVIELQNLSAVMSSVATQFKLHSWSPTEKTQSQQGACSILFKVSSVKILLYILLKQQCFLRQPIMFSLCQIRNN